MKTRLTQLSQDVRANKKEMKTTCSVCNNPMVPGNLATQVYRHGNTVVTVTGIPAVFTCPHCGNAILDWHIAQQVEDLVQPLLHRPDTHTLPEPIVSITFPTSLPIAA